MLGLMDWLTKVAEKIFCRTRGLCLMKQPETSAGGFFGIKKADTLVKPPANLGSLPIDQQAAIAGQEGGANLIEGAVNLVQVPGEMSVPGLAPGCHLQTGRDRPAEPGTGNKGPNNPAIYIVCSPSGRLINKSPVDKSGTALQVNRNFNHDDCFIYMTGRGDIDKYLGLAAGDMGRSVDTPAIAIKSSDLRFIARNGIKMVTGTDSSNSKGSTRASIVGIELIAGNDDSALQPIVKGDNLVGALEYYNKNVLSKLIAVLEKFAKYQNNLNDALKDHTHGSALKHLVGLIAASNPMAVAGGDVYEDIFVKIEGTITTELISNQIQKEIDNLRKNLTTFETTYLSGADNKKDINSRYNKVN